jgi:hypothetical protein
MYQIRVADESIGIKQPHICRVVSGRNFGQVDTWLHHCHNRLGLLGRFSFCCWCAFGAGSRITGHSEHCNGY